MNTKLSIEVNGIQVTGEIVERCSYSISVKILSPFNGLVKNKSMEIFSTRFKNFADEYGDVIAHKLLRELYDFCLNTDQNSEHIKKSIAKMLTEREKIRANMEPIYEKQRTFKKMFSKAQLTEKEYKTELLRLREMKKPYLQIISNIQLPPINILRYIKQNYGDFNI